FGPRRLRPHAAGVPAWSPAPTQGTIEIPSPAAPGASPFPAPSPLPEKALPAPEVFELSGWAVLRESDELHDVGLLGRIAARFMGVPVADATRRIRQTRGVIARGLAEDAARTLAAELSGNGVPAFAVDERASGGLPELAYVRSCTCGPEGLQFETPEGVKGTCPWRQILVIAAARLDEEDEFLVNTGEIENPFSGFGSMPSTSRRVTHTTVIDAVVAHPPARIRIAGRDASAAGLRPFAASILDARGSTPVNKGLSVIAGRGSWGYLAFSSPRAFEEHLWWLTQVIRRRSAPRAAEPPAPGGGVAGWLE
ncbi:MAG: hypothetical protein HUU15_20065, partial [Candidatus Brocadiae bacterium]|nr:hypothetical protein [Candidatus Brocadiia bacterium]